MIIDNPEQFKAWLTAVLEPLCDADPAALAKYVYALVKKDKTLDELRIGMVEQLDVFLQQETQSFVDLLFKTLETQNFTLPIVKTEEEGSRTPPTIAAQTPPTNEPSNVVLNTISTPHLNGSAPSAVSNANKRELRKSESEKEDKDRDKRPRSRGRPRSRTRSRSRSWERDRRRSRSRDHIRRDRERDRSRPWRNKSPPNLRRHDRRRTRSRSTSPLRSRNRDGPMEHRTRFRNRSPSPGLRSRSRSLDRKKRGGGMQQQQQQDGVLSPGGTPTQDSNHGDVDMRLSTTSQSIQSVVSVAGQAGNFGPKRRCRDFDEKGYCMRGDLCPYDHGIDPVVLEDVALSRVLTFGPHGAQAPAGVPVAAIPEAPPGPTGGPNGNAPPTHLPLASLPPPHLRNQHHANMELPIEYNPDAPSMEPQVPWGRHPPPPQPPVMYGRGQRELISVPVAQHTEPAEMPMQQQQQQQPPPQHQHHPPPQQQSHPHPPTGGGGNPLKRKQAFDFNRLGPKQRAVQNQANCSLELKKVPRSLNNITQLNNHFSKFGKIVNIQVNFGNDPEAALVTFQLPSEAKSAYRSTEAVLNNRFIKVFWHNNVNNNAAAAAIENVPPGKQSQQRPSVKDRLGQPVHNPNKVEDEYVPSRQPTVHQPQPHPQSQSLAPMAKPPVPVATREDKVLAIKKTQEILAAKETLKKKQEEKRKEAIKLTADLRKRKQELLDKQLVELRSLIERAEKNPDQKDTIMLTIKSMQQNIDGLRKDLATPVTTQANSVASKPMPKTREQAQKEILDAELDLMTAQQEGQDSTELQKRLLELRAQAAAMGLTSVGAGRGMRPTRPLRGAAISFRGGRGRGAANFAHASIDHRPTNLLVSGYETEEKADVLAHFQQYGEIVNQIVDDATPSIVINYKSRKEAELAMSKGRNFQDRTLSITWVAGHHLHRGGGNSASTTGTSLSVSSNTPRSEQLQSLSMTDEEIDLENVADVEALLLDEEEEEEDERSWRR